MRERLLLKIYATIGALVLFSMTMSMAFRADSVVEMLAWISVLLLIPVLLILLRRISKVRNRPLNEIFFVTFDDVTVRILFKPPLKAGWEQEFTWSSVTRICFKDEGPWLSDGIYVFTTLRPESFVIPIEASGGSEFFNAASSRGLFPPELMIKTASATDGGLYCWPPDEKGGGAC